MDKLKVGITGTGVIFNLNILGYLNRDGIEITSLGDRKNKHVEDKINKFNLRYKSKIHLVKEKTRLK